MDADEEVVGARGGDRVQGVPGQQWWVVRILNFDGEVFLSLEANISGARNTS